MSGKQGEVSGARTPEELETLLEDSLIVGDGDALAALFEEGAALVATHEPPTHGRESIERVALGIWGGAHPYVADPRHVVQARDVALVVGRCAINVARRGGDGAWRYAIVLQMVEDTSFIW